MELARQRRGRDAAATGSDFVELRMQLDDEFITDLASALGRHKATDVVRESLTILNWAVQERRRGRVILSATSDGENVVRLAMPALDGI
jgi:hypothetical protein